MIPPNAFSSSSARQRVTLLSGALWRIAATRPHRTIELDKVCSTDTKIFRFPHQSTPHRADCAVLLLANGTLTCFRALFYLCPASPRQITGRTCAPNGRLIIGVIALGSARRDKHCARTRVPFVPAAGVYTDAAAAVWHNNNCRQRVRVVEGSREIIMPTQFVLCVHRQCGRFGVRAAACPGWLFGAVRARASMLDIICECVPL